MKRIERSSGKISVRIDIDKYGASLCASRNGYHYTCIEIDEKTAVLVKNVLEDARPFLEIGRAHV